jgi:hypothetical protein
VLSALPATAQANPCVLEYVAGRNLLAPAFQPDIFIVREEIKFELRAFRGWVQYEDVRSREPMMEGDVKISYEFDNRGAPHELVIGFPIGLCNDGFCPAQDLISTFQASGAGVGKLLPSSNDDGFSLDRASLAMCEREKSAPARYDPHSNEVQKRPPQVAWYLWSQSFQAGVNKIAVRYHVKVLSGEASGDANLTISYILKTTAGWGNGKIGRLDILFSQHGPGGRWDVLHGPHPPNVMHQRRRLQWRLENFAPEEDLELEFTPPGGQYYGSAKE